MLKRAISGAVFVTLLVFSIIYNQYSFLALFFLFMIISVFEMSKMLQLKNKANYAIATLLFVYQLDFINSSAALLLEAATTISIVLLFIQQLFKKESEAIKDLGKIALSIIYGCVPFIFLSKITLLTGIFQSSILIGVFLLIWSSDTFAYLTGVSIGKHKLLERISPKKTIEGLLGGIIATMIVAYFLSKYIEVLSVIQWIVTGVIVSIFGVLGDLIASMFKRQTGVKDTGKIIPGHGGVIDRLDSIIFVAPIIYYYLKITLENVS